jgi:hypothetical protein
MGSLCTKNSVVALASSERLPSFRVVEGEVFRPNIARSGPLAIEIRVTFTPPIIVEAEFTVHQPSAASLDPPSMFKIPDVDICCPCCGGAEDDIDDYEPGSRPRCGWRYGMPVMRKELPKGFDDDLDDWVERAHPKDDAF